MIEFNDTSKLLDYIYNDSNFKLVIVCGYDNVGKGKLLSEFRKEVNIFYPDYDLICSAVPKDKRWTYFMYFLDMYTKLNARHECPLVFDRSSICGAVYGNDESIAKLYNLYIHGVEHLHILVKCSEEDYYKFQDIRGSETRFDYSLYLEHTNRYEYYFKKYNLSYIVFNNKYSEDYGDISKYSCLGCSFNKYGICNNKESKRTFVGEGTPRCDLFNIKEVQDLDE